MTTEAFVPTPIRTIAGVGPYSVDHPYQEGGLIIRVLASSTIAVLDPADYTVDPVKSDTVGDITLSASAAATYAGSDLQILRKTNVEQGWQGQGGAREKSLELQLDIVTQAQQDLEDELSRTFKVASGVIGDLPGDRAGKALIFDAQGSPVPGPDADAITAAQANAVAAAAAAQAAIDAAALAATFDPADFQPIDQTLTDLSGATVSTRGFQLLAAASAAAVRTVTGLDSGQLCGVGQITMHARGVVPDGKLELNGASYPYASYPELGAYLGFVPADVTISLEDWRGEAARGWDNGRGVDPGRAIGSFQGQGIQNHSHPVSFQTAEGPGNNVGDAFALAFAGQGPDRRSGGNTAGVVGASETRMRNRAVMFCIQYEA